MLKLAFLLLISCEALEVACVSSASCSGTACGKYYSWVHPGPIGDLDQALVVVSISVQLQNIAASSLTAVYGDQDMLVVGEYYIASPPQGIRGIKIFYLFGEQVSSGLQNVKVDWHGQTEDATDALVAGCVTYLGANQSSVPRILYGSQSEIVTSQPGNMIQDIVLFSKAGQMPAATGTLLWLNATDSIRGGAQFKLGNGQPVVMEWVSGGVYVAGAIDITASSSSVAPTSLQPSVASLSPSQVSPTSSTNSSSPSTLVSPTGVPTQSPSLPTSSPTSASPTILPTTAKAQDEGESFPWKIVGPILVAITLFMLAGCGSYVLKLKRRVHNAEELFLAPSDFAKLVQGPEDEIDPDALDFSESRPSRSNHF